MGAWGLVAPWGTQGALGGHRVTPRHFVPILCLGTPVGWGGDSGVPAPAMGAHPYGGAPAPMGGPELSGVQLHRRGTPP